MVGKERQAKLWRCFRDNKEFKVVPGAIYDPHALIILIICYLPTCCEKGIVDDKIAISISQPI